MIKQTLVGLIFPIFILFYPINKNFSEAYFFPRLLAFIIFFLLLLHWLFYFLKKAKDSNEASSTSEEKPLSAIIFYFIAVAIAILLLQYLGFYLISFLFYLAIGYYYRIENMNQKKRTLLISALLFVLAMYLVFAILLKVQTPSSF
jgi:Na+/melibiose symporter-like transporter